MTDWALSQLSIQDSRVLLDIGCGGGGALLRLSELAPQAGLHGIDYSPQALSVVARANRRLIEQGRVFLREADVSDLPYGDGHFDLVVAINSHHFWVDLTRGLREVMRVLQPGGTVALAGGEYFGGKHDTRNRRLASNGRMNCQTLPDLRDTLCEAGCSSTEIHEEWNKGWVCVVGRKPTKTNVPGAVLDDIRVLRDALEYGAQGAEETAEEYLAANANLLVELLDLVRDLPQEHLARLSRDHRLSSKLLDKEADWPGWCKKQVEQAVDYVQIKKGLGRPFNPHPMQSADLEPLERAMQYAKYAFPQVTREIRMHPLSDYLEARE